MKRFFLTFTATLFVFAAIAGDILTLKNEKVFDGKVTKIKDKEIVFSAGENSYVIPAADIFSVQFENTEDKVFTDYLESVENAPDKCMSGKLDAELYHGKKSGHFILGFLFGPFAMLGTALSNPTPQRGYKTYNMSKNKELFSDPEYLSCYKKKAKAQLIGAEAIGWGAWILLALLL